MRRATDRVARRAVDGSGTAGPYKSSRPSLRCPRRSIGRRTTCRSHTARTPPPHPIHSMPRPLPPPLSHAAFPPRQEVANTPSPCRGYRCWAQWMCVRACLRAFASTSARACVRRAMGGSACTRGPSRRVLCWQRLPSLAACRWKGYWMQHVVLVQLAVVLQNIVLRRSWHGAAAPYASGAIRKQGRVHSPPVRQPHP